MVMGPLIDEWKAARAALAEMERAEHPDIADHFGRVWVWKSKDIYVHDNAMAWTKDMILDGKCGLPSPKLKDNPNYDLCEICTKEW